MGFAGDLLGWFSSDLAIDLGTATTLVYSFWKLSEVLIETCPVSFEKPTPGKVSGRDDQRGRPSAFGDGVVPKRDEVKLIKVLCPPSKEIAPCEGKRSSARVYVSRFWTRRTEIS